MADEGAPGFFERLLRGRRREDPDAARREQPRLEVPRVPTEADLLGALDRTSALVTAGAVPGVVTSRVVRVTRIVRETIPLLPRMGAGSPQAYSVMATATDYLPEAIGGYLRLPRSFADTRPVDRGKTSLMILIDQLDLLAATMDQVFDAVCREDAAALVAHGRFLQEKFGQVSAGGALALDPGLPVPAPAPAEPEVPEVGRLQPPAAGPGMAGR